MAWIDGLCRLGRLSEALVVADRLDELAELFTYTSPLAIMYRALVLLEQGQLEQVARCCAQLPTTTHHDRYSVHRADGLELQVRAVLAYRQGDAETACSLFARLEQWADRTGEADPSYMPWAADAIAAHLACGRDTDAQHVLGWVAQRAEVLPSRWPKIVVATGKAALAERAGDRRLAENYFTQALNLHAELPMALARSRTLADYGAFLTRGGEIARARVLLAEALHIAEECGAGWHANRALPNGDEPVGAPAPTNPTSSAPRKPPSPSSLRPDEPTGRSPNSSICPSRQWKPTLGISIKNSPSAADGSSPDAQSRTPKYDLEGPMRSAHPDHYFCAPRFAVGVTAAVIDSTTCSAASPRTPAGFRAVVRWRPATQRQG